MRKTDGATGPSQTAPELPSGTSVFHPRFGLGEVEMDKGATALVRFGQSYESCEKRALEVRPTLEQAIATLSWSDPSAVIAKAQAAAITSLNDAWGVFSRSRITLLPHQLWVCHRVLRRWPARYLIADDVGLGKTIEAGLILWPILSKQLVKRLLILCPAKLAEQWQLRLKEMFDIRLHLYTPEIDTNRSDFWGLHSQVVASVQTLRTNSRGRRERLLSAEPWDLLIVDEAHHLNNDEKTGKTLGYELVEKLVDTGQVESCLFFTGTPHRGKNFGFWSLLKLLRPDLFDPSRSSNEQYNLLPDVLIRNNKRSVMDMRGNKLFRPIVQHPETYSYSQAEEYFYQKLTLFIASGRAYASSLSAQGGRQVVLVLIAMQKLASSSVAAIRRAIRGRLQRLREARDASAAFERSPSRNDGGFGPLDDADLLDVQQQLDEQIASEPDPAVRLMKNEIRHLEELLKAAEAVTDETKIDRLVEVVDERFRGESVLFFTEYKATQALVMSAIQSRFGDGCVTFINGDEALEDIVRSNGQAESLRVPRLDAAAQFNNGTVRFLVSTEAGGEGIDLQRRCHSLVHVDLPWNPMRLHQRVGRLDRYGQTHEVQVVTLRNPDTVESLIWEKLNAKLEEIMRALGSAMDEPEDLLQLVLGMAGSSVFQEIFSEAPEVDCEHISDWFDEKAKTFGGQSAIETVKALVGNSTRFDYQGVGEIPKVDLPALRSFFDNSLRANGRRASWTDETLSFKTPEPWLSDRGVRSYYNGLVFSRDSLRGQDSQNVIGVGHRAFDQALRSALQAPAALAAVRDLADPVVVYQICDEVTEHSGALQSVAVGVEVKSESSAVKLLNDGELLELLNSLSVIGSQLTPKVDRAAIDAARNRGLRCVNEALVSLKLPFAAPRVRVLACLWPLGE